MQEVLFHLIDLDTLLAPSGKEPDAAKKKQLRESLAAGPLLTWFAGLERFAGRNASGWLVGDSLTVADLALYSRVMSFKLGKCVPTHSYSARAVAALLARRAGCNTDALLQVRRHPGQHRGRLPQGVGAVRPRAQAPQGGRVERHAGPLSERGCATDGFDAASCVSCVPLQSLHNRQDRRL